MRSCSGPFRQLCTLPGEASKVHIAETFGRVESQGKEIIGESPALKEVLRQLEVVDLTDTSVLVRA
jgi:transcriptional regulator with GAF, ATPase, and Fis domain